MISMYVRVLPVLWSLVLALPGGTIQAQARGREVSANKGIAETKPSLFARLFHNPTGKNGYEEWVQAADLIQNDADVDAAALPGASLSLKRQTLAHPSVAQALRLLKDGSKLAVSSPREDFDENTLLPELPLFRRLARLLCTQQYVNCADGRMASAIDSLRVGLTFGYRIQTDCLLSGMIGLAVDTLVLDEFARHLDQLSINQCDQVFRLIQDFLNAESPAVRLLTLERGHALNMLEKRRSDAGSLQTLLKIFDLKKHPEDAADVQSVQEHIVNQPQNLNVLLGDAQIRIAAVYDQALLNLRLPFTQRMPLLKDSTDVPAAALCRLLAADTGRITDIYTRDQAKLRLLSVHVLIHRYQWEHNSLPNSLTELRADDLITDPFTGEQIVYQRDGAHYALYSQGPFKRGEVGQASSKEREPVRLIP